MSRSVHSIQRSVGTTVTVTCGNVASLPVWAFTQLTGIRLGSLPVAFATLADGGAPGVTQTAFVVPSGAQSGPITVTDQFGCTVASVPFTVSP